ncbi:50S ribosomal protein L4 [Candidatus Aerophobetes bacterium]|uniref:Large ribosomal subunit protein uL4 n=1 Tax=Aerophobetes bacterium TaxID=2030807 RepID=A0A662DMS7_UNCAE|nr:MAG: 50S ribosomal protein L4 [Candidatus Aerophobetes bacterium]
MEWDVYNMQGEKIGSCGLEDDIFAGEVNQPLLREAVLAYQTNLRQGTVSTKTRGEVSGGGRKPWPQKGTGRARAGSIRSPLWVGGGVVFGPKPRNFSYPLPKKKRKLALVSALRLKIKERKLFILDKLAIEKGKTKEMASFLANFVKTDDHKEKSLVVVSEKDEKLKRASSNIKTLRLVMADNLSACHILFHDNVFFTQESIMRLVKRLKNE